MKRALVLATALTVTIAGAAQAQMAVRPSILRPAAPSAASPAAVDAQPAPEWYKSFLALQKRVEVLEAQLHSANQELAAFRAEYGTHTHSIYQPRLSWDNRPMASKASLITAWLPNRKVTSGPPVQVAPDTAVGN